jgi:hypothetical protein
MGERNPADDQRVVVRHIGEEVVEAVFELDVHSAPELLDIERCIAPVDPDLLADLPHFVR